MEKELLYTAIPVVLKEDEQEWDLMDTLKDANDGRLKMLWGSNVPGSGAPERLMIAAVQAKENRGYIVSDAESLINRGLEAKSKNDMAELHRVSAELNYNINNAKKDDSSSYWSFKEYSCFEDYLSDVSFPKFDGFKLSKEDFLKKTRAGWLAQLIGGAHGTALEGYTHDKLYERFGHITDYVRKPNTYNDDITYELAFLKAVEEKGKDVTSKDIAIEWVSLIPGGWSAEEIALQNIKNGIFPPNSGILNNPFNEWIGAQMRGAICGMVAPGDPQLASRLAWMDGEISHINNGILGEIFNAVLISLSYVKDDINEILKFTIDSIPKQSEFYEIVDFTYKACLQNDNWLDAWRLCEKRVEKYNWIHAYPNIAAQIVALHFGEGDFDKTMEIIAMAGMDVDCNAAQIMTAIGIIIGEESIDNKWKEPIGEVINTYVRGYEEITLNELSEWTLRGLLHF